MSGGRSSHSPARLGIVEKPGDHAQQVQLLGVDHRIGRVHRAQRNLWLQLQALDGELPADLCDDDVTVRGFLRAIDDHHVAVIQTQVFHAAAAGAHEKRGGPVGDAELVQVQFIG